MVSDMVRHQTIHLSNPDINYVRLENCKYCKMARMRNYDRHRRNNSIPQTINAIDYYGYDLVYFNPLFDPEYEDVELDTSLKRINSCTNLKISKKETFCAICQDSIKKDVIVREINCGHTFHQECADKWLETNKLCPVCRYEI